MTASFAARETRLNSAVVRHLANADAEWLSLAGGTKKTVPVIFDNSYGDAFSGLVGGQQPTAQGAAADFAGVANDDSLVIGGAEYIVTNVEPDGTGMVVLRLREV